MKKLTTCLIGYLVLVAGLVFAPASAMPRAARAQTNAVTPNPYIDALGTQAALNTQATLAAYQQQQDAANAAAQAAAAQAQASALQAQAAYVAQQGTFAAGQQQAALVAAQSTADAAALQATAIVQQTRTALEIAAQQTREAGNVRATATAQALQSKATQAAIEQTHVAAEAQRHDNAAISTAVAMSIQATQTAIDRQARAEADFAERERSALALGSVVSSVVIVVAGVLIMLLIGKFFRGLWRSRALNPKPASPDPLGVRPVTSSASESIVDASTGEVGPRLAIIEYNDNPDALDNLLRSLDDH